MISTTSCVELCTKFISKYPINIVEQLHYLDKTSSWLWLPACHWRMVSKNEKNGSEKWSVHVKKTPATSN